MAVMRRLETHYRDLCEIEFTIERGKLWMLQTRVGKRTAAAAFRVAMQLVDEQLITVDEALVRVTGAQLAQLMFPQFDASVPKDRLTIGIGASPGAASGRIVFDSAAATAWAARGERVILVRRETNPEDLEGMIAAVGVLTARGGKTSHAAVVARGMGKTCVCGADQLEIDATAGTLEVKGKILHEGDLISIDGSTGEVFAGAGGVVDSPVTKLLAVGLDEALVGVDEPDGRPAARRRPPARPRRPGAPARGPRQRRQRAGRRTGPPPRGRGCGPVPYRAHVPRRPQGAARASHPGVDRRQPARPLSMRYFPCSATTSSSC